VNVSLLFQIAGVGFVVMLITTVLKQAGKDEQGQMVTLVGVLLVLMLVVKLLSEFFGVVKSAFWGMG
jgi:stage III sporulation protein AC